MIKVAVIILNWNGRKLLEKFLPAVVQHSAEEGCQVIVADNASSDDSVSFLNERYPDVPVIALDRNYGFADGYNRAIRQVDAKYVVLLNSDVETTPGWLHPLVRYMDEHPEVVAAQPKIRSYNKRIFFEYAGAAGGFLDRYGYPFCRGRILQNVEKDEGQYDSVIPIFWATGAAMFIRKKDFLDAGGLDGRFFAHMEEIDLCWRLNARGKRIVCVPSSVVYHVGGASLNQDNPQKMYLNFRNNLLMLYKNLLPEEIFPVFVSRCLFDSMAFFHLLLEGKFNSAKEVIHAYRDFYKMIRSYKSVRMLNLQYAVTRRLPVQYQGSVLINYYLRRKRNFEQLFGHKIIFFQNIKSTD